MKYFIYLSKEQKEKFADIIEETEEAKEEIINKFNDYIEQNELEEYVEILLDYLYREEFKEELTRLNNRHDISNLTTHEQAEYKNKNREIAKHKTQNSLRRIKENINVMQINIKFETLMDLIYHTNLDWLDTEKIYQKNQSLSKEELKKIAIKSNQSFGKKRLKASPNIIQTPTSLINRDEDF